MLEAAAFSKRLLMPAYFTSGFRFLQGNVRSMIRSMGIEDVSKLMISALRKCLPASWRAVAKYWGKASCGYGLQDRSSSMTIVDGYHLEGVEIGCCVLCRCWWCDIIWGLRMERLHHGRLNWRPWAGLSSIPASTPTSSASTWISLFKLFLWGVERIVRALQLYFEQFSMGLQVIQLRTSCPYSQPTHGVQDLIWYSFKKAFLK